MFEQVKYLSRKYDIYMISFMRDWEEQGLGPLRPFCKEIDVVRIEDRNLRSYSLTKPGFIKNYYSQEMDCLISRKIADKRFDIIQFEYLPMAQYIRKVDARTILTEHQAGFLCLKKELEIERGFFKKIVLFFRYKRLLKYETKILKKFDRIVFISSKEAGCFNDANSFVSPMGVDAEYFKRNESYKEDTDLVYIGNFDNYQNKDAIFYFFKEIWPVIKKKRPKASLSVVGYRSKEVLSFLEKEDGIKVAGYVEDIRRCIDKARVYILPARIGGGMKGKLLEAFSMEKPAVSTSVGIEGYNGDILKAVKTADTAEDFANSVLYLIDNEDIRIKMGQTGREAVEKNYTWSHIFSEMETIYGY